MSSVSQFPPPHLISEEEPSKDRENDDQGAKSQANNESSSGPRLALPAPGDALSSSIQVDQDDSIIKFDQLGPMVVSNHDKIAT